MKILDDCIIASEEMIYSIGANIKKRAAVLLINSSKIIYRAVYAQKSELKPTWEQVCDVFPIGDLLNENTHSFDSKIYTNSISKIHLIAAVPKKIIDDTLSNAIDALGRSSEVKIMEPIECRIIDLYGDEDDVWLVFSQDENLRIIVVFNGLPSEVHIISTKKELMESQLKRMTMPEKIYFIELPWVCDIDISNLQEFCDENNIILNRRIICTQ